MICDSCEEFRLGLTDLLGDRYLIRSCGDGVRAMKLLEEFCPDLLVVDLILQGVDGLAVMRQAQNLEQIPAIFTVSAFYPPYAVDQFPDLNVAFATQKPCDLRALSDRIDDLVENVCVPSLPVTTPRCAVTAALMELGFHPNRAGFQYIRDAIIMLSDNPGLRVTKHIYPELAKRYRTGDTAVEKNIRDAISSLWQNTDLQILRRYFPPAPNGKIPRPSNPVFLSTMAEMLFNVRKDG